MTLTLAGGLTREYLLHHKLCPRRLADDGEALVLAAAPGALLDGVEDMRVETGAHAPRR